LALGLRFCGTVMGTRQLIFARFSRIGWLDSFHSWRYRVPFLAAVQYHCLLPILAGLWGMAAGIARVYTRPQCAWAICGGGGIWNVAVAHPTGRAPCPR